jgi:hypothetical protein
MKVAERILNTAFEQQGEYQMAHNRLGSVGKLENDEIDKA